MKFLHCTTASSLYYLSELVEEHTVLTKRVLSYMINSIIVIQVLLFVVDGFPWRLIALGVASHLVYQRNLRRFPTVRLKDPWFIASCGESLHFVSLGGIMMDVLFS